MASFSDSTLTRRELLGGLAYGAATAAVPALWMDAAEAQVVDCLARWREMLGLRDAQGQIARQVSAIMSAASTQSGLTATQSLANQTLSVHKAMVSMTGRRVMLGAVTAGTASQESFALSQIKSLGPAVTAKRVAAANSAVAAGNFASVTGDSLFGPIVKAGVNSMQGFIKQMSSTASALRTMEANNLALFAKQVSDARAAKQLTDSQIDRLIKLYANHAGIVATLTKVRSASTALPVQDLKFGAAAVPVDGCLTCELPDSATTGLADRLFGLFGIRSAHALEPMTTVVIVIAVLNAINMVVALAVLTKCAATELAPDALASCMDEARREYEASLAAAEQRRQACVASCVLGVCTPGFVCDAAKATEVALASAGYWAKEQACYLTAAQQGVASQL